MFDKSIRSGLTCRIDINEPYKIVLKDYILNPVFISPNCSFSLSLKIHQ